MKEYKFKINGNSYNVSVSQIDNNTAQVEVNGVPYKVESAAEMAAAAPVVAAPRPAAAPRTESGTSRSSQRGCFGYQVAAARCCKQHSGKSRR